MILPLVTVSVTTLVVPGAPVVVVAEVAAVLGEDVSLAVGELVVAVLLVVVSDDAVVEEGVALEPELLYAVLLVGPWLQPVIAAPRASTATNGMMRFIDSSRFSLRGTDL
jgi:hypothetical protein